MAIITNNLRQLAIDAFVDLLTNVTDTKNAYFFFGKSAPWTDDQSVKGIGTVVTNLTEPAKIDISGGSFSGIALNDLIKNLDNGEVRQVKYINSTTQLTLSAVPGIAWNTANWAFKRAEDGTVWVDDNNPPAPTDCVRNLSDCAATMLALKKVDQANLDNNASRVIPRYDWDENEETVYAPYKDNDGDLLLHPTEADVLAANQWNTQHPDPADAYTPGSHFVLVSTGSNLHVFKCLENGNGAKSTIKPDKSLCNADNNYTHVSAVDGYKWKFMYSLSAQQVIRFLTDSWVPIREAVNPGTNPDAGDQNAEQWEVQTTTERGTIDAYTLIKVDNDIDSLYQYGDSLVGTALPDQTGLNTNEIKLGVGASTDNAAYLGCQVFIFSSNVNINAQIRTIVSYVGSTQVATLDSPWAYVPTSADKCCVAPKVTVVGYQGVGGGRLAKARAVILANKISSIQVIDTGTEYRSAAAKVTVQVAGEDLEVAQIKPELSPLLGHGANAVDELGGYFLMMNVRLKNEEGLQNTDPDSTFDFMRLNDYRTIGIIRNVSKSSVYSTAETLKAVKTLLVGDLENGTGFLQDEVIEYRDSGNAVIAKGYVVEYMSVVGDDNDTLTIFQDLNTGFASFTPVVNGRLVGITSGENAAISSVIDTEVDPYSGEILYIEQRKPIIRAEQQLEDIKIVIEF